MPRILIVEDEPEMLMGLEDNFQFEGYTVLKAGDGVSGLEIALAEQPDLIILDVMLPKKSGFDVCRELRAQGATIPIIMLTARGQEIDKVRGLELGADDYLTKPFSLRELLARVKAVLRRYAPAAGSSAHVLKLGELEIDFTHYTAIKCGQPIEFTHKEFEVLKYFLAHKGQTVSRSELLDEVWGYDAAPTTRTVDNHILKLRQKIEDDPAQPKYILTVHGIGYKFVG
jgi:two-component system alkaline phosphatase synthesis response regulator PhoP